MIDVVLVALVLVSAILGLMRGFVGILVSTVAWLLAGLVAFKFGPEAALWLSSNGQPSISETFGGYALSFIVVLLAVGMVGAVVRSMVRASELSGVDRALGFGVGVFRGLVIACLLVLVLGFTPLPKEPSWRQSQVLPVLMPGVSWMRAQLPEWSVPDPGSRNAPRSGDNDQLGAPSPTLVEGALRQVLERSETAARTWTLEAVADGSSDPDNVDDPGQDPANIETARVDPAQVEQPAQRSSGQGTANVEPVAE